MEQEPGIELSDLGTGAVVEEDGFRDSNINTVEDVQSTARSHNISRRKLRRPLTPSNPDDGSLKTDPAVMQETYPSFMEASGSLSIGVDVGSNGSEAITIEGSSDSGVSASNQSTVEVPPGRQWTGLNEDVICFRGDVRVARKTRARERKLFIWKRHFLVGYFFIVLIVVNMIRANMPIAMIYMVKTTYGIYHNSTNSSTTPGEFYWSYLTQGIILACYFIGYSAGICTYVIMKRSISFSVIFFIGTLLVSTFSFVIPSAARFGLVVSLCYVRILQGLGHCLITPSIRVIISNWIPRSERMMVDALLHSSVPLGDVCSLIMVGTISSFELSWEYVFYTSGVIGLLWILPMRHIVRDSPIIYHPRLTLAECTTFFDHTLGRQVFWGEIPWSSIFKSLATWAILIPHVGYSLGYECLSMQLPIYLQYVLNFSLLKNGLFLSGSYFGMATTTILVGFFLSSNQSRVNRIILRKVFTFISMYGIAGSLYLLAFFDYDRRWKLITIAVGLTLNGFSFAGFLMGHNDLTPTFGTALHFVSTVIAEVTSFIGPLLTGLILESDNYSQNWALSFCVTAAVFLLTGSMYILHGSGQVQSWDLSYANRP